jgi:hypothetical protein
VATSDRLNTASDTSGSKYRRPTSKTTTCKRHGPSRTGGDPPEHPGPDPPASPGLGSTGIYKSCSDAPKAPPPCLTVGGVGYTYGIGEFDVTVSQYVTFLNTVDPRGRNTLQLYFDDMSPTAWPQYGSIRYTPGAGLGQHYSVAYPEWADKPFNFANFSRAARFANSLTNGKVLSRTQSTSHGFNYVTYTVRLSPDTERGMYDLANPATTRAKSTGFVIPSNNEWVKAAYYDPKGGGTDSYWAYPTGPFRQPNVAVLNPSNGNVENASDQPLATYNPNDPNSSDDTPGAPPGKAPTWCPSQAGSSCGDLPADFPQGLDLRDWHYYHGGVANAPAYQLEISAFGYNFGDPAIERIYPWYGFRVGVIGTP